MNGGDPATSGVHPPDTDLTGIPFADHDDVIRAAIDEASAPALLMSMVHMTGSLDVLEELPKPAMLISSDIQGGMSDQDRQVVRDRAFRIACRYRDEGCPPAFIPDAQQLQTMLDVVTGGPVDDGYLDYIAADLRINGLDEPGPALASTPEQRNEVPVVVIGCGEAGILAGIKLSQAGIPFTIIDRQSGLGGTWLANRYPGCRVDISNHYYSYSFERTDHWSHFFSEQPEILAYLNDVADRHGLHPHIRLNTEVVAAAWHDQSSTWRVQTRDADGATETLTARAVICAVGQFSNPVIPDIAGRESFAGPNFHTADWPDDLDLSDKRVAVIGAGASGFQLVPAIAPITRNVDVYQRTPQWMAPNPNYHARIGDGAKWAVRHLPYYGRWLRFVQWWPITDGATSKIMIDPDWDTGGLSVSQNNHDVRELFSAWLKAFTEDDDELLAKVTPKYPPMGKRLLQDNGTWLKTLRRDDVELITERIAEITPTGVATADGTHRPADILVWATGFDVNRQLGPITVRGRHGRSLNDVWGDNAYAYLGITVPDFPNFFCMYGPGTNAVNGASIIYNSECQMRYILGCIDMLAAENLGSLTVRADVCEDYSRRSIERLAKMVYTHPSVASYYRNSSGATPTLFAWRIIDLWNWTRAPDPDHYERSPMNGQGATQPAGATAR